APPRRTPRLPTTEHASGDKLHTCPIVDAITDQNVLPFRIDYINTVKLPEHLADKQVSAIDTERALLAPERVTQIVDYVLEHFDQKTRQERTYKLGDKRVAGFNSIFATASIDAAKRYYTAFEQAQHRREEADPSYERLKVALIYSYAANEEEPDGLLSEEGFETGGLDVSSRDFLEDRSEEHTSELQSRFDLVCRLLL